MYALSSFIFPSLCADSVLSLDVLGSLTTLATGYFSWKTRNRTLYMMILGANRHARLRHVCVLSLHLSAYADTDVITLADIGSSHGFTPADWELDKAAVRRLDWTVLPLCALVYLLNFLECARDTSSGPSRRR